MKLTDIKPQVIIKESVLVEKLGTLSQLGIGPLINVLKQPIIGTSRTGRGGEAGEVGSKFYGHEIGSTSEIRNVGVIKDGLKSIRKAYKTNEGARAFALYIGDKPVLFGIYDDYDLAGSSRTGRLAYDLNAFKSTIDEIDAEKAAGASTWAKPSPTQITTYREKEQYEFEKRRGKTKPRQFQGQAAPTSQLADVINLIMEVAKRVGQPVTAKLVMIDTAAGSKRTKRYTSRQIGDGVKDLRARLAIYKNMKKPTVDTIEDFVAMSVKNQGKQVRFAGTTYVLKTSGYDKLDPGALLAGKPFEISYSSSDPGVYDSLRVTYAFDAASNMLKPVYAVWYDRRNPADRYSRQEAVLDGPGYLKVKLSVTDLDDKKAVIPKILEKFKASQYSEVIYLIDALKKAGKDWPEIDTIEKSAKLELERKKASGS